MWERDCDEDENLSWGLRHVKWWCLDRRHFGSDGIKPLAPLSLTFGLFNNCWSYSRPWPTFLTRKKPKLKMDTTCPSCPAWLLSSCITAWSAQAGQIKQVLSLTHTLSHTHTLTFPTRTRRTWGDVFNLWQEWESWHLQTSAGSTHTHTHSPASSLKSFDQLIHTLLT